MQDCQSYFLRLLARRDYSARELERKASSKGYAPADIADAIAEVRGRDFQSDLRTAEGIIEAARGRYGPTAVRRKCLEKGIAAEVFEHAWDDVASDRDFEAELEQVKAKAMRQYRLDGFDNLDPATTRKLANFLQYRGFNAFAVLAQWQNK
ncbi:hypothetical protein KR51_00030300 [Rubidibacter lacunae KORDI 51-2]|uniref:Regulatory protein RecX n=1 Tax=Rubidibacter lacunae KORDI 51-2 TaxID=582515 RepID=U5DIR2_9CHRO|nr:RecX family transcriptional regulator [Rubidibacter lacunae]ERN40484.1 hypothetical protein KR51_00030300 [Rubidibacter lacunae KORDI 51-2]